MKLTRMYSDFINICSGTLNRVVEFLIEFALSFDLLAGDIEYGLQKAGYDKIRIEELEHSVRLEAIDIAAQDMVLASEAKLNARVEKIKTTAKIED